jgi:hypothetical protein
MKDVMSQFHPLAKLDFHARLHVHLRWFSQSCGIMPDLIPIMIV